MMSLMTLLLGLLVLSCSKKFENTDSSLMNELKKGSTTANGGNAQSLMVSLEAEETYTKENDQLWLFNSLGAGSNYTVSVLPTPSGLLARLLVGTAKLADLNRTMVNDRCAYWNGNSIDEDTYTPRILGIDYTITVTPTNLISDPKTYWVKVLDDGTSMEIPFDLTLATEWFTGNTLGGKYTFDLKMTNPLYATDPSQPEFISRITDLKAELWSESTLLNTVYPEQELIIADNSNLGILGVMQYNGNASLSKGDKSQLTNMLHSTNSSYGGKSPNEIMDILALDTFKNNDGGIGYMSIVKAQPKFILDSAGNYTIKVYATLKGINGMSESTFVYSININYLGNPCVY